MTVRILLQQSRKPLEIATGKPRTEKWETLENVSEISDYGNYKRFTYTDGTSYSIAKDYLTRYEIV